MGDPLATVAGPPPKRRFTMWKLVVAWQALGFDLSWHKGQRGPRVDWVGAQSGPWRTPSGKHGVEVTIIEEKIVKIRGVIEQFHSQGAKVDK